MTRPLSLLCTLALLAVTLPATASSIVEAETAVTTDDHRCRGDIDSYCETEFDGETGYCGIWVKTRGCFFFFCVGCPPPPFDDAVRAT